MNKFEAMGPKQAYFKLNRAGPLLIGTLCRGVLFVDPCFCHLMLASLSLTDFLFLSLFHRSSGPDPGQDSGSGGSSAAALRWPALRAHTARPGVLHRHGRRCWSVSVFNSVEWKWKLCLMQVELIPSCVLAWLHMHFHFMNLCVCPGPCLSVELALVCLSSCLVPSLCLQVSE